ncbi:MAG TPA: prepilin-type N-terminal cleavage/methylation domain-containing protein [Candidatus Paceibacterota bacterium]|nr:prepilin-type N-terminal cleavage/methylation domain-containing protein [Candidatus Pacearchaeota archaeon]HRZ50873.1 prepilin-type N-terminal cleavage/methylation domain-containing protein [Candidatus Paceibacterota bacterium]HSA36594.1 prepilin-type N-terminal cleavage/methylation domain-containing protein [Candidatus Paceibacterota bacterium]
MISKIKIKKIENSIFSEAKKMLRRFTGAEQKKGFTLVELVVALGIFSMALGITSQTFVAGIKLQRKFLASTESLNEISYLMEYMARSIRMAYKDMTPVCLSAAKLNYEATYGGEGVKFMKKNSQCQEFYLDGETLYESKNNGAEINALTSPKVKVVAFNVGPSTSWDQNDEEQPRVTLFLEVEAKDGTRVKMQTTVSQRNKDTRK